LVNQRTLSSAVKLSGIGLHTGTICEIELCPAPENHWYKFQRIDLENDPIIEASALNVSTTQRGTTLVKNGAEVNTVEHLLAALYASEVDNVLIKINGPEIPILDGSSKYFLEAVKSAGITEQSAARKFINIEETIPFEITEIEAEF